MQAAVHTELKNERIKTTPSSETAIKPSYLYPILGALLLPIIIGLFKPLLLTWVSLFLFLFAIYLPMVTISRIVYDWTQGESFFKTLLRYVRPIPSGIVYGNDLKRDGFPWVVTILIFLNITSFFTASEEFIEANVFPPLGDPSITQIVISVFTSTFLHADFSHLLFNMIFLWTFGSAIETRIGALHFITSYFICIFASNVLDIVLLNIQSDFLESTEALGGYHSLGASGAISGIMGIFVVRCFFARLSISVPFLFLPFISLPIRVQGTFLIGIFFAMDFSGSVSQFVEDSSQIDYWAHVGGYLTGFALAYMMRLQINASEESIKLKAERINQKHGISENATDLYADILKKEPENEPALRYFFELHKYNHNKAESYFVRLIQVLMKKDFKQALELFNEHFPNFLNELPGDVLIRFGLYFFKNADLYKARICLEFASEKEGIWQAKAMITLAQIFESIGNEQYAKSIYNNIVNRFANSVFHKEAKARLLRQKGISG